MASREAPFLNLEADHKKRHPVVRVYPWNFKTADEILSSLKQLKGKSRLVKGPNLIEVNLAVKSASSVVSPGMATPIGGEVAVDESVIAAAYRKTKDETTLHTVPYNQGKHIYIAPDTYSYNIPFGNYSSQDREVTIVSLPVISTNIERAYAQNREGSKIEKFMRVSIDGLAEAHIKGRVKEFKLLESSVFSSSASIKISRDESIKRAASLNGLINFLNSEEESLRKQISAKFIQKIARRSSAKSWKNHGFTQLYLEAQKIMKEEEVDFLMRASIDEVRMEMYTERFRRIEKEVKSISDSKSETKMASEARALGQLALALKRLPEVVEGSVHVAEGKRKKELDNTQRFLERTGIRLKEEAQIIKQGLNKGNHGLDVLQMLALITQTESAGAVTTRTALAMNRFLFNAFSMAAAKCDISPEAMFGKIVGRNKDVGNMTADLSRMDDAFIKVIAHAFGDHEAYVRSVLREIVHFIPDFGDSIKNVDPKLRDLYQVHEERNEVSKATLPQLCAYALHHQDPTVKFEAARKMLIFFKALLAKKIYDRKVNEGSSFHDNAISYYFGPVATKEGKLRTYKIEHEGFKQVLEIRSNSHWSNDPFFVIVDPKPPKTFLSFLRKSFEVDPEEIHDLFSCSVAFLTLPKSLPQSTVEERIASIQMITEEFIIYMKEQGFKIDNDDDEDTYNTIIDSLRNGNSIDGKGGKRTGSKSNSIIRRQFNSTAKKDGITSTMEIAIYPFVSFEEEDVKQLKDYERLAQIKDGLLDYVLKHLDDPLYTLRRMNQPQKAKDDVGSLGSHRGLMFPPDKYEELRP